MSKPEELEIMIYHNGAHFTAPIRGRERFLLERAFLDDLIAPQWGRHRRDRPIPDPTTDFYMLDDQQLEAYSAFRHKLDAEERAGAAVNRKGDQAR